MAAASATLSSAALAAATAPNLPKRTTTKVHYTSGLNTTSDGLKPRNRLSLGQPLGTQQSFLSVVDSRKISRNRGGEAPRSVAGEIFQIAAIMNGLVLVGVAVGFVLLRLEASIEEAE